MQIPGNLDELLHNRPAMVGLGLAGAAGVAVWLHRRGAGRNSPNSSAGTATSGTGGVGGVGTFDSTGTDIAAFLGDYSGRLDTQLGGYINQLNSTVDALKNVPTTPPPSPPAQVRYSASAGVSVPGWIQGLQAAGVNVTYDQLVALNPDLPANIAWSSGPDRNADKFRTTATYRVA